MEKSLSRKARRKQTPQREVYRNFKKNAAVLGTAAVACSVVTPLIPVVEVAADDTGVSVLSTSSSFIDEMAAYAQPIANANDLYASVMMAQAIIESAWGQSLLSQAPYHNLFGIKGSYNGETVYMNTQEFLNGQWVTMKEPFKKYPSFGESFADNAATLRNVSLQAGVYYYAGAWKSNTNSYRDATAWLTGRYATAPTYASSLNNVIETYNLTRFDTPASGTPGQGMGNVNTPVSTNPSTPVTPTPTPNKPSTPTTGGSSYTVQSGDSVWAISAKYGITMDQLRSWNNIQNDFIYPGQTLTVKQGTSNTEKPATPTTPNKPVATTPSKPSTGGNGSYTVQSGDSVWSISDKYGISMDQLRSWNNIQNDLIFPGQKLVVKQGSTSKPAPKPTPVQTSKPSTGGNGSYTVQSGDSVWSISDKYGISMDQLRNWNNIQNDLIIPGQKLVVKQGSSNTAKPVSTAPAQTSKPSTSGNGSYTVQSGDSVWTIADKYGISMDQLRSWNNIQNDFIYAGQKLVVKQGSTNSVATSTPSTSIPASTTNTSGVKKYTVQAGDSVWSIADKHGITMDQLISWNNIKNNTIHPDQKLIVKQGNAGNGSTNNSSTSGSSYKVKSGDNLWSIADHYNTSVDALKALNNLSSDNIYLGQSLKIK